MSSNPSAPSMSYSPAYYHARGGTPKPPSTSSARSPVLPPAPAHLSQHSHSSSRRPSIQPDGRPNVRGSTSSASSGHSDAPRKSYPQQIYSPSYSLSSHAERGSLDRRSDKRKIESGHLRHQASMSGTTYHTRIGSSYPDTVVYPQHDDEGLASERKPAFWVLIWLSFLEPAYSLFGALYTLFVLVFLILLLPLRLCRNTCTMSTSLITLISPFFRYRLRMLKTQSAEHMHNFEYEAAMLVMINIIAPFLSVGVAVSAWIAASFWIFALIMGNPDGTERGDDGEKTVFGVRTWWEKYLMRAVKS